MCHYHLEKINSYIHYSVFNSDEHKSYLKINKEIKLILNINFALGLFGE